jgi:hypothetical protein
MAPRSGPVLDRVRGEVRFTIKQLLGFSQILTLCIACVPCTERESAVGAPAAAQRKGGRLRLPVAGERVFLVAADAHDA